MRPFPSSRFTACAAACLLTLAVAGTAHARSASAKDYQVTGKVLSVSESMIVVDKDGERWEVARDADTKIEGRLKVGEKVTIHYHMVADSAEVKM